MEKQIKWRAPARFEMVQNTDGTGDLLGAVFAPIDGVEITGNGSLQAPLTVKFAQGVKLARHKSFERVVDVPGLDDVCRALRAAEDEIHNPGCARTNNYDVLDLISQARVAMKRAIAGEA